MTPESAARIDERSCRVLDAMGVHVGNLNWVGGAWKFKAIGHDASGAVIPGGGPLTDRHNTVFGSLDLAQINRVLGLAPSAQSGTKAVATTPGRGGCARSPRWPST